MPPETCARVSTTRRRPARLARRRHRTSLLRLTLDGNVSHTTTVPTCEHTVEQKAGWKCTDCLSMANMSTQNSGKSNDHDAQRHRPHQLHSGLYVVSCGTTFYQNRASVSLATAYAKVISGNPSLCKPRLTQFPRRAELLWVHWRSARRLLGDPGFERGLLDLPCPRRLR